MVFRTSRLRTSGSAHRRPAAACLAAVAFVAGACTGPALHLENPDGHPAFLDGVATGPGEKPFRYYGTARWDALPADRSGHPDWHHLPASREVAIEAPVSPWLFPLDFPLELLARLADGRRDVSTRIEVPPAATDPRTLAEIANTELAALAQRARQARSSR